MNITAAILRTQGTPLTVERVQLDPPNDGEVLVEVKAAGVCHSDLHVARGDWPTATPVVLGHEGAGWIEEVGDGVTHLQVGNPVVIAYRAPCDQCHESPSIAAFASARPTPVSSR